jgi:hypothetical protein
MTVEKKSEREVEGMFVQSQSSVRAANDGANTGSWRKIPGGSRFPVGGIAPITPYGNSGDCASKTLCRRWECAGAMDGPGFPLTHGAVRGVKRFTAECVKRWNCFAMTTGESGWLCDVSRRGA